MTLENASYGDLGYRRSDLSRVKRAHHYTVTYTTEVYLYADETRSGASSRVQCSWNLNATLNRRIKRDDGKFAESKDYASEQVPSNGVTTDRGTFCWSLEDRQNIIDLINARVRRPFWDTIIKTDEADVVRRLRLKELPTRMSNSLALGRMAIACHRRQNAACRYHITKAAAVAWLTTPDVPSLGVAMPLSSQERAMLQNYVAQLGDEKKESPVLDKVVDHFMDWAQDRATKAAPILGIIGPIAKDVMTGVPNGTISEASQVEFGRMTDEELNAVEAQANTMLAGLSAAARDTPNGDLSDNLKASMSYFSDRKAAIAAERNIRAGAIGGAANGGSHRASSASSHDTRTASTRGSIGGGQSADSRGVGAPAHEGAQGPADHDHVGSHFNGGGAMRFHFDKPRQGSEEDHGNDDGQSGQGLVANPGPT